MASPEMAAWGGLGSEESPPAALSLLASAPAGSFGTNHTASLFDCTKTCIVGGCHCPKSQDSKNHADLRDEKKYKVSQKANPSPFTLG